MRIRTALAAGVLATAALLGGAGSALAAGGHDHHEGGAAAIEGGFVHEEGQGSYSNLGGPAGITHISGSGSKTAGAFKAGGVWGR
ncbi:hypothetical protein [Streptomyces sp. NPDC088725]|uniref:hypothetical protein n=1 Tax=Streptomyces sp. NPDC088725 TaxID=3365873 RepID=UPI00381F652B